MPCPQPRLRGQRIFRQPIVFLLLGLAVSAPCRATEQVTLYLYNTTPPLDLQTLGNLSVRLAKLLSDDSGGKYQFKTAYLPRKRLDILVSSGNWEGAVIWANPTWFRDPAQKRYLWSSPLATDYNLVLSHKQKPVEYATPASLQGLRLGGVLGHVYPELDLMFRQGRLARDDATSYLQNLLKLREKRVDVIFMPASALAIWKRQYPDWNEWVYVSKTPQGVFDYHVFCDRSNTKLMAFLDEAVRRLQNNPEWRDTVSTWKPVP